MSRKEHQIWVAGFNQGYEQAILNMIFYLKNKELKKIRKIEIKK